MSSLMTRKLGNLQTLESVWLFKISKFFQDICKKDICENVKHTSCELFSTIALTFIRKSLHGREMETKYFLNLPLAFHLQWLLCSEDRMEERQKYFLNASCMSATLHTGKHKLLLSFLRRPKLFNYLFVVHDWQTKIT